MADPESSLAAALGDRYRLDRVLGEGGMATVYLAHDLKHDRPVALKVLKPELAHALGPERFEREIKLAARLQHPHILTVLDSGEAAVERSALSAQRSALLYFTMPCVEGESLRDRLNREKQLPVEDALRIAREAAQALQYAHEHGVIHRDIKPENLLLTRDGSTLVADFGIARTLGGSAGETLTRTGTSVGTAAYMSPEQAAGERDLDARSDVYSLGIVLYEMLAGQTPFDAPTAQATIARRFIDVPRPIRLLRDSVPEAVESALQKALARTAADRFASARLFGDALAAPGASATSAPPARQARQRVPLAVALLGLGLAIGGGLLFAWRARENVTSGPVTARARAVADRPVRIAVLPFENLGDSADAYFADGMSDAVRGKLTELGGIDVVARASSEQYRGTTKPPGQIADELNADYLLMGTVRWSKDAGGVSRVQVSPELVEIGDGTAPSRWQQPFDASLTDVFQVQADIAGKVAGALNLALRAGDEEQLAVRPTRNLAAYDAYLKAEAVTGSDPYSLKRAIEFNEEAVRLDPRFGIAWARLAFLRARMRMSAPGLPLAAIDTALERARAFAPEAAETYRARNFVAVIRSDSTAALAALHEGLARYPANPDLLRGLASALRGSGPELTDSALALYRRALELDPRSLPTMQSLGRFLLTLDRLAEARAVFRRMLDIAPGDLRTLGDLADTYLDEGDLAGARRVLASAGPTVDRIQLFTFFAVFDDRYWVLTDAQLDTMLALPDARFDGPSSAHALLFASVHALRRNSSLAHRWGDSAAAAAREELQLAPADVQAPMLLGLALAYAGHTAEAIQWGNKGLALARASDIPPAVPYAEYVLVRILLLDGQPNNALALLERADRTSAPYFRAGRLRIDPAFAGLRGNPRFEVLAAKGAP